MSEENNKPAVNKDDGKTLSIDELIKMANDFDVKHRRFWDTAFKPLPISHELLPFPKLSDHNICPQAGLQDLSCDEYARIGKGTDYVYGADFARNPDITSFVHYGRMNDLTLNFVTTDYLPKIEILNRYPKRRSSRRWMKKYKKKYGTQLVDNTNIYFVHGKAVMTDKVLKRLKEKIDRDMKMTQDFFLQNALSGRSSGEAKIEERESCLDSIECGWKETREIKEK